MMMIIGVSGGGRPMAAAYIGATEVPWRSPHPHIIEDGEGFGGERRKHLTIERSNKCN